MINLEEKNTFFNKIKKLTLHHKKNCNIYNSFFKFQKINLKKINSLENLPYIPVRAFKEFDLISVKKKEVYKVLHSSGTSSQKPSKIYLDKKIQKNKLMFLVKFIKIFLSLRGYQC